MFNDNGEQITYTKYEDYLAAGAELARRGEMFAERGLILQADSCLNQMEILNKRHLAFFERMISEGKKPL